MVFKFACKIKQKKRGKRMFEQELWKNFCNYLEPFGRFNCSHKILPSVLPIQMSESPIIKRRFSMKKTTSYEEENDELQSRKHSYTERKTMYKYH